MHVPIHAQTIVESIPGKDIEEFVVILNHKIQSLNQVVRDYPIRKNEDKDSYIGRIYQNGPAFCGYSAHILGEAWDYKNSKNKTA